MNWQDATDTLLNTLIEKKSFGLITDVDGTISEIVNDPNAATIYEPSRKLLTDLIPLVDLAGVISGRAAADIHKRVGLEGMVYVGNHGLEEWKDGEVVAVPEVEPYLPAVQAAADKINMQIAQSLPGMWVENKKVTLSVHYRNVDEPDVVAAEYPPAMQQIVDEHGLRLFEGRRIFEVRPPIDIDKGAAFQRLVEEHALEAAIYLGDDITDVDAFKVARALRAADTCYALALGVTSETTPQPVLDHADVLASGVSDVASFFEWLLRSLKASSN